MRYAGAKRFIQPKQGAFLGLWLNKEDLYKKKRHNSSIWAMAWTAFFLYAFVNNNRFSKQ
jgi:hypothetical protein